MIGLAAAALAAAAPADTIKLKRPQCAVTRIASVGTRLEDTPGSGSAIIYADGRRQISYQQVPAADRSRAGDRVRLCVIARPASCPPGDDRGAILAATNLRTKARWHLPDSAHRCGGA